MRRASMEATSAWLSCWTALTAHERERACDTFLVLVVVFGVQLRRSVDPRVLVPDRDGGARRDSVASSARVRNNHWLPIAGNLGRRELTAEANKRECEAVYVVADVADLHGQQFLAPVGLRLSRLEQL